MMYFIKLAGAFLLLFGALSFSREYESRLQKSLDLCLGFQSLMTHVKRKVEGYLTPASRLLEGFECGALLDIGYLPLAVDVGICDAYFKLEEDMPLSHGTRSTLRGFFCDFGKDYQGVTVKAAEIAAKELKNEADLLKEEYRRRLKLARTLATAASLGIILLLL